MTNFNFSINQEVKENVNKQLYPVDIHENNYITAAEYNEEHDCLDITIENENYKYRERMFNPTKNISGLTWTTPEKEIAKFLSRIKHFLKRFMTEEEASFSASTFREMCEKTAELLLVHAIEPKKLISVKFVYDKNFKYPQLPKNAPFLASNDEKPLQYTKYEENNHLIPKEAVSTGSDSTNDIF